MSGDLAPLPELVELKEAHPDLLFYLDDAHGLGVMGPGGRGTAHHFGLADKMDFIMGTFSKALASIGGFIAGDDEDAFTFLRHHSRTLIFSAALPASCTATVMACLRIIREEPERVARLSGVTKKAHAGYLEIGLKCGECQSPIVPILVGPEEKAARLAADLFEHGIFALPAVFPAVPRGKAVIRTAYMSTHKDPQVDHKILKLLDQGVVPWHKPWRTICNGTDCGAFFNLKTKRAYRGANVILLASSGFDSPYFASLKQINSMGGRVKAGSQATQVIFWKRVEVDDGDGGKKVIPLLRYYNVFNIAEQTEGLEDKLPKSAKVELAQHERIA